MKRISALLLALCAAAFCTPRFAQAQNAEIFRQEGIASWYGPEFDGRPTASGEVFNSSFFTAAHPTLPFGTMLLVTNRHNNRQVTVRVNDRGPFVSARVIDVSKAAAEQLDMLVTGTAPVLVESIDRIVMPSAGTAAPPAPTADPYWTLPPAQPAAPPAQTYVPPPEYTLAPSPATPPVQTYAPPPEYTPVPAPTPAPAQTYVPPPEYTLAPIPAAPPAQTYAPPPEYALTATPPAPSPAADPAASVPAIPAPVYGPAALTPAITPSPGKTYRLQVGSYKVARNAVESFERLKNAGLNPNYERNGEFFRVVLAGIRGSEVQSIADKLGAAGFREALIREER
jgi:rare lipoprotein A